MARFNYEGRNREGNKVAGIIDGTSESAIAAELIHNGITPITIKAYVEQSKKVSKLTAWLQLEAPNIQDLTFLCRQLTSLFKAGVPIVRAVHVVMDSSKNYRLKEALGDMLAILQEGQSLSVGMRHHMDIFPTLMAALVNVGENTGSLDEVFKQMAVHFEREANTRKQISSAIRYPITVVTVISIAIVVINVLVIPAFAKFFTQFHSTLPLPTRLLIASSNFFVNYWYLVVAIVVGTIGGFNFYIRTQKGRYTWDRFKLSIPLIGSIMDRALLSRFARSFALSVRTGVPLMDTIQMISKATDNAYVGEKIAAMRTYIEHGESLTIAATKSEMFTPLVLQMLSIGEETGEIDKLLDEVADYYEKEVDYEVERLGDAIEPILICAIAAMVLVLALGVFLPMWDIWKVALGK